MLLKSLRSYEGSEVDQQGYSSNNFMVDRIVAEGDSGAKLGTNHPLYPSPCLSIPLA